MVVQIDKDSADDGYRLSYCENLVNTEYELEYFNPTGIPDYFITMISYSDKE